MLVSNCCGAPISGEIVDIVGMCSDCHEWAEIESDENEFDIDNDKLILQSLRQR
jgi:hypothetical protein